MKESEELLVIEPIIGYRQWDIYCEKEKGKYKFRLEGSGIGAKAGFWTSGINKARCLKKDRFAKRIFSNHKIPEFNCECGFYAHKYKIDIIKELLRIRNPANTLFPIGIFNDNSNISLYGIVELTGRVIEHSEGYRAEKAEIKKLFWADERDKLNISYEDKDKKVKEKKEENKAKNNNIPPKSLTPIMTATAASIFNNYNQHLQQQVQMQAQQQAQLQTQRQQYNIRGLSPTSFISDDLNETRDIKDFTKEQIIKSLQDYYQVPIIYYKDYLEKELLK